MVWTRKLMGGIGGMVWTRKLMGGIGGMVFIAIRAAIHAANRVTICVTIRVTIHAANRVTIRATIHAANRVTIRATIRAQRFLPQPQKSCVQVGKSLINLGLQNIRIVDDPFCISQGRPQRSCAGNRELVACRRLAGFSLIHLLRQRSGISRGHHMNLDRCRNRRIPDAGCCNPVCPKRRVLIGSDLPALVDNGEVLPQLPTRSSRGNSPSDLLAPVIRFTEGGCCVDLEVNLCIPALNYLGPLHLQLNRFRPRVGTDLLNGFQIHYSPCSWRDRHPNQSRSNPPASLMPGWP